jgi:hypothetical protein
MEARFLKIRITGRSIWAGGWSENKPHLLNKLNYSPWDIPLIGKVGAVVLEVRETTYRKIGQLASA